MIGYKVVQKVNHRMYSVSFDVCFDGDNPGITEYKLNEWVGRPLFHGKKCGPLTAFKTLKDAKIFTLGEYHIHLSITHPCEIFKVKLRKSITNHLWTFDEYNDWNPSISDLPTGTILADEIMLLGLVCVLKD